MKYLEELNEAQRAAVENTEGPVMVIAGAGSGKTRVLTYRVAHLINKGADPFNILALTFTNKAAREMKERIATIVGEAEAKNIWMGTFHSIFARILRVESEKLGYPSNFTIYDTADTKSLLKTIIKGLALDDKLYKPGIVYGRISSAKNNLISPLAYLEHAEIQTDDRMAGRPRLGEIYQAYASRCFKAGAMDFDDLLFKTNVLLRDFPDVLHKYQHKFKYLLVDEYQDTNYSQYLIVKKLAALNENLCVVGDDAQSIYAFRGANIQNILNFKNDYPDYKLFKLEQNYRSTQIIVNAANSIIANNKDQIQKEVWTSNEEGSKIKLMRALTDNEEGRQVAGSIFDVKMTEQAKNSDFAILYRTNAQSRSMEEALRKLDVPYRIYGGLSFYQRKEIKDMIAYLRMCINPADEEALKRVINYPVRGIGKTSIDRIILAAGENDVSLWDVITDPNDYNTGIGGGARTKIAEFITMIKGFQTMLDSKNAFELATTVAQSSGILKEHYADKSPEGISRYENIQELLNGIKEFCDKKTEEGTEAASLGAFLQDVALLTDADSDDGDDDKVSLMTVHAAKGLEFEYVHIVGMEENLFPSQMALNSRSDLEEERRLFYVALTRAKKRAWLSYANTRYRWGNLISCEPSRFVEEVEDRFLDAPFDTDSFKSSAPSVKPQRSFQPKTAAQAAPKGTAKASSQPNPNLLGKKKLVKVSKAATALVSPASQEEMKALAVGMRVAHERFGTGEVVVLEGAFPNQKATVDFSGVGKKQLLLKFARLEILK